MDYAILVSFIGATAALSISPGPDNIFVLIQSVVNGVKYGLATVLGLMSGCLVHTALVAFGVSVIIKENPELFFAIKTFGAMYLLFLAYKVFRSNSEIMLTANSVEKKSFMMLFKQGFLMNVLNPKVSIFFLAFFPGFLFSDTLNTVIQFYVLGVLFIVTSFIIFSSIALLAGSISKSIKQNSKVGLYLKWMQIVVFVAIAIFILVT